MNKLQNLFGKSKYLIGALHFPPLPGFAGFTSIEEILSFSLNNAKVLEEAGFDGIIVENNYDLPHQIKVGPETVAAMTYLTQKIMEEIKIPIGISVLWNSYRTGLSIAKVVGAKFIRVPVFIDQVETSYGVIEGDAKDVLEFRRKIEAEDVLLLTDVQVKHSTLLNVRPIAEAATEAVKEESDGIIVTGKWTGDAPNLEKLADTRQAVGKDFPVIVGSGATKENIQKLLQFSDGVIVGTALKQGEVQTKEQQTNLLPAQAPIDLEKAVEFVQAFGQKKNPVTSL